VECAGRDTPSVARRLYDARVPSLLPPAQLEPLARSLAALDAILAEDWESRYYSFNTKWGKGQRMASMRDGCGDEWFLVFTNDGAFLKGLAHEYPPGDVATIYDGLPAKLQKLRTEPSFSMDDTSYGGWFDKTWTLRSAPKLAKVMREHLDILDGKPKTYRAYAEGYFEAEVPLAAIEHVYAGKPIDQKLIDFINPERTLADLQSDLTEIGYGKPRATRRGRPATSKRKQNA
jgi:hypothetical protein